MVRILTCKKDFLRNRLSKGRQKEGRKIVKKGEKGASELSISSETGQVIIPSAKGRGDDYLAY
jgi:hypothetical protein